MKSKIFIALVSIMAVFVILFFVVAYSEDDNSVSVKAVVDRFEGDRAVLLVGEEEIPVNIPRKLLPKGARPGESWLTLSFELDFEKEQEQWEKIGNLLEKIKKR